MTCMKQMLDDRKERHIEPESGMIKILKPSDRKQPWLSQLALENRRPADYSFDFAPQPPKQLQILDRTPAAVTTQLHLPDENANLPVDGKTEETFWEDGDDDDADEQVAKMEVSMENASLRLQEEKSFAGK